MKLDVKTLNAIGNLGRTFVLHSLRRAIRGRGKGDGKRTFMENYRADAFVALTPGERAALHGYEKCIACGVCASVCPVYSPARDGAYRAPDSITAALTRSFPDFTYARDAVYNCTRCRACETACPRGIKVPELVAMARRIAWRQDERGVRGMYAGVVGNLERTGNPFGEGTVQIGEFRREKAEYVFIAGCVARHRLRDKTLKTLEFLDGMGVNFTTVEETCCGNAYLALGMEDAAADAARALIRTVRRTGTDRVITLCPHCFHSFRTFRPYAEALKVSHTLQILRAAPGGAGAARAETVTYHDACFISRWAGLYDEPRKALADAGVSVAEMKRNRESAFCCGSPLGAFIEDAAVIESMRRERLAEAVDTGAEKLIAECPACVLAFSGIAGDGMKVQLLTEYLREKTP
ncbi:MAG: (Fe-S)-binding protein [bacterium]